MLTLSEIYIYTDFCGILIDKNKDEDKPVEIQLSKPANESFNNLELKNNLDVNEFILKQINDAFLLDDVDVDELKVYVENVTGETNFIEKLLNRISEMETEIKKLKEENKNNEI